MEGGPGLAPSPQVLRLYLYQCSLCTTWWLSPAKEATTQHCNNPPIFVKGPIRVQIDPQSRIELSPLPPPIKESDENEKR